MSPGAYALVVMNIEGPGAQQGFPQEISTAPTLGPGAR